MKEHLPDRLTQRRFPRYQIQLPLLHKTKPPLPIRFGVGWTRNLSEGGTCVELSEHFQPMMPLRVSLQTDQGAIEVEAQVVWTGERGGEKGGVPHGVAFTQVGADQLRALRNLIASKGKAREAGVRLPLRLPVTCDVKEQTGFSLNGMTGDMSRGGLSLRLPQPLPPGTAVGMTLHMPNGPLTAEGVVVWVGPQDQRMPGEPVWHGVRFTALGWTTALSLGLFLVDPV
jgi:hypothetical protein